MTLAARLEDLEVTLEHMLMDVFVSLHHSCYCVFNRSNRTLLS